MEKYLDDRVIISDDIKKMSSEELAAMIEKLENEHKLKSKSKPQQSGK